MELLTGTIVDGKVVLLGGELPEGTEVAVMAKSTEVDSLSPELLAELNEAITEADLEEGEGITPEELFEQLKKYE